MIELVQRTMKADSPIEPQWKAPIDAVGLKSCGAFEQTPYDLLPPNPQVLAHSYLSGIPETDLGFKQVMSDMYELQLLDAISGQCDRHFGNFFVRYKRKENAKKALLGIDLDMAWGLLDDPWRNNNNIGTGWRSRCKLYAPPSMISDVTYNRITRIDSEVLSGLFSLYPALATEELLLAANKRLVKVIEHIEHLKTQGRVMSVEHLAFDTLVTVENCMMKDYVEQWNKQKACLDGDDCHYTRKKKKKLSLSGSGSQNPMDQYFKY